MYGIKTNKINKEKRNDLTLYIKTVTGASGSNITKEELNL